MRATLLDVDGLVVNVVMVGDEWEPPEGQTIGPGDGHIGWTWSGSEWIKPAPEPVPPATANDVRAEAQRRIIALTGASDIIGCLTKQHNAQMRATELTLVLALGGQWTPQQAAEAAALQGMANAVRAIRDRSNILEPMNPIPTDYTSNVYWE